MRGCFRLCLGCSRLCFPSKRTVSAKRTRPVGWGSTPREEACNRITSSERNAFARLGSLHCGNILGV
eukprot:733251-Prymnesium_polylepis.1